MSFLMKKRIPLETFSLSYGRGLAVIYRIIEEHNGHIILNSELGKGTTFELLFKPIARDQITQESSSQQESIPIEGDGSEILVVDDEEMLAEQISDLLHGSVYKPHFFTNSIAALELFKQRPSQFSLIITDQTMPKLAGTELIEEIRNISPNFPAIICSGYSDKINAHSASKLNIAYLTKPVDSKQLLEQVTSAIGISRGMELKNAANS